MTVFPFTAVVGQEELKTALVLNVVDPSIGGLLIMGEKGTAKSTAVRALADLLPEMETVRGCPFNCDPEGPLCPRCRDAAVRGGSLETERRKMRVVELPLGITEDRLVGTLDIGYALKTGEKRFEPGILADANRNFLYVDEVNLLEDHLVDLLLDSAAMGVNTVEREGVSFSHPARFILVGTMNPEEGDLRPQLLDRFGLCVRVSSVMDKAARVEILRRRASFDADPALFLARWEEEQRALARRIAAAKARREETVVADGILEKIVEITSALSLDGHRADIVIMKASRALAALRGKASVGDEEVKEAALLALSHRLKRKPFEDVEGEREKVQSLLKEL
ncbi:MAG TPA: ATP-binding protein [Syntrophales bacterium]|nr:ATP-binding protein [Syntrophales bacterium]HOM06623.1 ATP-binding protein [Syntrophales bacterium]HON99773.1 ATP-binding protein [Syntrophales bacterium]HPC01127.1 ATP-binding protein [Syntrophales bacterium]HPQ06284.1 ATP-binding protein [Syntrophales bacterium]